MNTDAANTVAQTQQTLLFIIVISLILLIGITCTIVYYLVRYSRKRNPVATDIAGNKWLEISWTILPTLLALLMFYYGYVSYQVSRTTMQASLEINATARRWAYLFKYPNNKISQDLYLPTGRSAKIYLTSTDVIHGFYIPAFRLKHDMVPGRNDYINFTPLREGKYDLFCTQYCGVGHSGMRAHVIVMNPKEFELWYKKPEIQKPIDVKKAFAGTPDQVAEGMKVYEQNCAQCHGADGTGSALPGARNFTSMTGWKNGTKISQMFQTVTKGLGAQMPPFGQLSVEDRFNVIHYEQKYGKGHAKDTPADMTALDKLYNLSKGGIQQYEIPVSEVMRELADANIRQPQNVLSDSQIEQMNRSYPDAARIYEMQCASCHGARGEGSAQGMGTNWRASFHLALNDPNRPWRKGALPLFKERIRASSVATGGLKPSFSELTDGEWIELYRYVTGFGAEKK